MSSAEKREVKIFLKLYNQIRAGLNEAEQNLAGFRSKANAMFKNVAKVAAGSFVAAATASILVGASFEQSMANVGSVASATEQEMASLTAQARELGATTAFSAREAADSMYSLASAGLSANEIIAASEGVLKLAGATMSDMSSASELVVSTMAQFGIAATETDRIVNVMAAGIKSSQLNMERLSYSMVYAGPMASALGMSLEETVASLGLLHNAGLMGMKAGTGLRAVFNSLLTPTDSLKRVLGGTSIEADGMSAVLGKLADANLTAAEMTEMFSVEGFSAIDALVKAGVDGFGKMTAGVTGTTAAFEMYERQMATTRGKWDELTSAAEEVGIGIFLAIKPRLDALVVAAAEFVNEAAPKFTALAMSIVDAVQQAWPIVAGIAGGIYGAFVYVYNALSPVVDLFTTLFNAMAQHQSTVESMAVGIGVAALATWGLSLALLGWSKAQALVNLAMAANPIGAILTLIGLLVGAVVGIVHSFGGWRNAWIEMETAMSGATVEEATRHFEVFGGVVKAVAVTVGGLGYVIWKLISLVVEAGGAIVHFVTLIATRGISNFGDTMQRSFGAIKTDMLQVVKDVGGSIGQAWGDAFKEHAIASAAMLPGEFLDAQKTAIDALAEKLKAGAGAAGPLKIKVAVEVDTSTAGAGASGLHLDTEVRDQVKKAQNELEVWYAYLAGKGDNVLIPADAAGKGKLANELRTETEAAYVVLEEFNAAAQQVFLSGWDSIIDSSQTGAQKWGAIWTGMKQRAWGIIGDVVKRWIWGQTVQLASTTTTEAAKTTATNAGVAARMVAGAKEIAMSLKSGVVNIWHAVTGFYKAHAGIPFVGAAIAAAAVVGMMKMISMAKNAVFHEGGWVDGRAGAAVGSREVQATLLRDEFVMNPRASDRWGPLLEMLNAGLNPFAGGAANSSGLAFAGAAPASGAAASAGGPRKIEIHLHVDRGSLLMADDKLAVRRFAERIGEELEKIDATHTG